MYTLAAASLCVAAGAGISLPFLPLMLQELGVVRHVETWVGTIIGSYFLLSFVLTPLWGAVADHYGRKVMVLRTGLGMGLLHVTLSLAGSPWVFACIYFFLGTTNGFMPASQALVVTNTPPRRIGKVLSMLQGMAMVGNTAGPVIGALLASVFPSYRYLYVVTGAMMALGGLLALVFARERHERPQGRFRPNLLHDLAIVRRLPNMGVLMGLNFVYTLSIFGSMAIISVLTLELAGPGAPGAATGAATVAATSAAGATAASSHSVNFWIGAVAMAFTVGCAVGLPAWGAGLDRFGPAIVLAVALFAGMAGTVPVALSQSPLQLALARFAMGLTVAGIGPALVAMTKARAPSGMDARVLSYATAFGMLGLGAGPLAAGQIGPWLGLRAYFALNAVLLLGMGLWWMRSWLGSPATPRG